MAILRKEFVTQPSAIASYPYTEIREGTGFSLFSGYVTEDDGGLDYHLTTDNTIYSSVIESIDTDATAPSIDLDFDLSPFNLPQTITGTATVSFTLVAATQADTTMTALATVYIRKVPVVGAEEEIVSAITPTITVAAGSTTTKELMTFPLTIPKTHFKKGEKLRLSVVAVGTRTGGANNISVLYGHDPRNRDGAVIVPSTDDPDTITKLLFYCPFDIDL